MEIMTLKKTQQNEVFNEIIMAGLDPSNFEWVNYQSQKSKGLIISKLIYKETSYCYWFEISDYNHDLMTVFSPGKDKLIEEEYPGDWENQINYVKIWLKFLKKEIDEPSLWDGLKLFKLPNEEGAELKDSQLNVAQIDKIASELDKLHEYIIKFFPLQKEEKEFVKTQFDYLKDTLNTQTRQNIKYFLYSTLFAIYLKYPEAFSEHALNIFKMIKNISSAFMKALMGA